MKGASYTFVERSSISAEIFLSLDNLKGFFLSSVHCSSFQEFWLSFCVQFLSVVFHRNKIPDCVWMGYCSKVTFSWETVTLTTCNRWTLNGLVLSILMISSSATIFNLREVFLFKSQILESSVNFYFRLLLCISNPQTLTVNESIAALIEIVNYRNILITANVINHSQVLWKLEEFISIWDKTLRGTSVWDCLMKNARMSKPVPCTWVIGNTKTQTWCLFLSLPGFWKWIHPSPVADAGGGRAMCVLWCHDAQATTTTPVCSVHQCRDPVL